MGRGQGYSGGDERWRPDEFDDGFGPPLRPDDAPREPGGSGGETDDFGPPERGRLGQDGPPPPPPAGRRDRGGRGGDEPGPRTREPQRQGPVLPARVTAARTRRRPGAWRSGARQLLAGAITLALVVLAAATALGVYATVSLNRVDVQGLAEPSDGVMNVLLVGSDSREGLTQEQLIELATDGTPGQRTDSILLLSVRGGSAAVLAFPRDLYVSRCDGSRGRINGAYATGGPTCLAQTVSQASGIPVTHYMEIDFLGFVDLVNAVGGVSVFLDAPMADRDAGLDLPAGCNLLNGAQSLGFVRARKIDSDLGRVARQQRFLAELAEEVVTPATVLNPVRLFRTTGAGARALTADEGLGLIDLARLARAGRGLAAGGLATYTVPTTGDTIDGASVQIQSEEADAVFARFASGAVLDAPAGAPGAAPAASDIVVDVLNATDVGGLAARGAEVMTQRGFTVGEVGNAEPVARSVVRYRPGAEAAAQVVAEQLPGVLTEAAPDAESELALLLGTDAESLFDTPAPPPVTAAPAPAPPPPGAASEPGQSATDVVGVAEPPENC